MNYIDCFCVVEYSINSKNINCLFHYEIFVKITQNYLNSILNNHVSCLTQPLMFLKQHSFNNKS